MKNDGGKAFPISGMAVRNGQHFEQVYQTGLSLRDYFAAAALPRVHEIVLDFMGKDAPPSGEPTLAQLTAKYAYDYADAMLAEREK